MLWFAISGICLLVAVAQLVAVVWPAVRTWLKSHFII